MSDDLKFIRQLDKMSPKQVNELSETMTESALAYELGGNWRLPFMIKKNKYPCGYAHRVYTMLATMHHTKIEYLTRAIT
jgi:hypothetical protein